MVADFRPADWCKIVPACKIWILGKHRNSLLHWLNFELAYIHSPFDPISLSIPYHLCIVTEIVQMDVCVCVLHLQLAHFIRLAMRRSPERAFTWPVLDIQQDFFIVSVWSMPTPSSEKMGRAVRQVTDYGGYCASYVNFRKTQLCFQGHSKLDCVFLILLNRSADSEVKLTQSHRPRDCGDCCVYIIHLRLHSWFQHVLSLSYHQSCNLRG